MIGHEFTFGGTRMTALPSGALYWPARSMLIVSDLHLGKSARMARRGGALIPPYETRETLEKLGRAILATGATNVLALGDSFDDATAAKELDPADAERLYGLMAGRGWIWVAGNHDPGPPGEFGVETSDITLDGLHFRHIGGGTMPEISGHLHPKARLAGRSHACFVTDGNRLILPAFGAYTGGLWASDPAIAGLFTAPACAILTGVRCRFIPLLVA